MKLEQLLDLPSELCNYFLAFLEVPDILTLRAVDHAFHDFIHCREDQLFDMVGRKLWSQHGVNFASFTSDTTRSLHNLALAYRTMNSMKHLAETLAECVLRAAKPSGRHLDLRTDRERWRRDLAGKLAAFLEGPLIILQEYLVRVADVYKKGEIDLHDFSPGEYLSLHDIYEQDQTRILRAFNLSVEQITQMTRALQIMQGVLREHNLAASTVLSKTEGIDVNTVMIIKGLVPFRRILDTDDLHEQRQLCRSIAKQVAEEQPYRAIPLSSIASKCTSIHHIGAYSQIRPKARRPEYLLRPSEERCQFWIQQDLLCTTAAIEIGRYTGTWRDFSCIGKYLEEWLTETSGEVVALNASWHR